MKCPPFRGSPGPSLGVELELQLVDAQSWATRDAAEEVLSELPGELRDSVKPELHSCCVEVNTGICRDVPEVEADLRPKLRALRDAAGRRGLRVAWGGTHPFSHWLGQGITPTARYRALVEHYRESLLRQSTYGLHVHVGVPDGEAAIRACDRIRAYLPALLALSANSPFWCGRATGLQAHRVEVMGSAPTGGPPPRLRSWGEFAGLVDRLIGAGCIASYKDLWWDVRPSPTLGTVEVRLCDMPADLDWVLGLTALIQCLVRAGSRDSEGEGPPDAEASRMLLIRQNRWNAARFGLDAGLIDLETGRRRRARDVVRRLACDLRSLGRELGCAAHLERARALAEGPTGADRLLAVHRRSGDLAAVVRRMVPNLEPGPHRAARRPARRPGRPESGSVPVGA